MLHTSYSEEEEEEEEIAPSPQMLSSSTITTNKPHFSILQEEQQIQKPYEVVEVFDGVLKNLGKEKKKKKKKKKKYLMNNETAAHLLVMLSSNISIPKQSPDSHQCFVCGKTFLSFHALGGHYSHCRPKRRNNLGEKKKRKPHDENQVIDGISMDSNEEKETERLEEKSHENKVLVNGVSVDLNEEWMSNKSLKLQPCDKNKLLFDGVSMDLGEEKDIKTLEEKLHHKNKVLLDGVSVDLGEDMETNTSLKEEPCDKNKLLLDGVSMDLGEEKQHKIAAHCLLMLSSNLSIPKRRLQPQSHNETKRLVNGVSMDLGDEEKNHKCLICSKVFPSGQALGGHMRAHSAYGAPKNHKCLICDRDFNSRHSFYSHRSRYHGVDGGEKKMKGMLTTSLCLDLNLTAELFCTQGLSPVSPLMPCAYT